MAGIGMQGGVPGGIQGGIPGAPVDKQGLLQFIAQGIKTQIPEAKVEVKEDGVEVIFTKEMILGKLFEKAGNLSQITDVEVDTRGIIVKVKV